MTRGAALLGGVLVALLVSQTARAEVQVQIQLEPTTVEVGGTVTVQVSAMGSDASPQDPQLKVPQGMKLRGPSISTSHQISITGAGFQRIQGITATWRLVPSKVGTFAIGPASVQTEAGRVQGLAATLRVVRKGTLPQRRRRRRGFPFDDDLFPGGSLFNDLLGNPPIRRTPEAPQEYQREHAADPLAFLHATVSPKTVVIGEQVSLQIFAYGSRGRFSELNSREPRHPDFYAHTLQDRLRNPPTYGVTIDGREYQTARLRHLALFPLKAGQLSVGPMTTNFYGSQYLSRQHPEGPERSSPPVTVTVIEPPLEGRPRGYQIGDVGDYRLKAEVSPRKVEAGGSISVVATLEGKGLVPSALQTPDQKGVEWLEPTVKDNLTKTADGIIGGSRVFTYIVRLNKEGNVDLGEVRLPYYSPARRGYRTARAALGTVVVAPPTTATATAQKSLQARERSRIKLSELLPVRRERTQSASSPWYLIDSPWFWPAMLAGPFGILMLQLTHGVFSRWLRRRRSRRDSPAYLAKQALGDAKRRLQADDSRDAIGAIERALFLGIEAATAIKARALLLSELEGRLSEHMPRPLAQELCSLLKECDAARFASSSLAPKEMLTRARTLVNQLSTGAAPRNSGPGAAA